MNNEHMNNQIESGCIGKNHQIRCHPPALMTEDELIQFLRIKEVAKTDNHHYVVQNLMRMHDLPCVHLCRQPLFALKNVLEWIDLQCEKEKKMMFLMTSYDKMVILTAGSVLPAKVEKGNAL
jgi:hypothetical protein